LVNIDMHGQQNIKTSGLGPPHVRGSTITHKNTVLGRTPLVEWSARHRDL